MPLRSALLVVIASVITCDGLVPNLRKKLSHAGVDWAALGRAIPHSPHAPQRPKVAFVFMLTDRLEYPSLWEQFFLDANPRDYAVLVHTASSTATIPDFFRRHLQPHVRTERCHLTEAQFMLMRDAFADPSVTHVAWLSGDSVPVKRLAHVLRALERDPNTRLCVDDFHDRAEMWSVIQRRQGLALLGAEQSLYGAFRGFKKACEDEDMYWEPLRLMGFESEITRQCVMWTDWGAGRHEPGFRNSKSGWLEDGRVNKAEAPGPHEHPWTFREVPRDGMRRILSDADLWFARKFRKGGSVFDSDGAEVGSLDELLVDSVSAGQMSQERPKKALAHLRNLDRALDAAAPTPGRGNHSK